MKKPTITVTVTNSSTMSLEDALAQFDREIPNYVRPPEGHQIFQLIGRVAVEWAHLEHVLDRIIWSLAGAISARAACITAQIMGATNRYKTIVAQLHLMSYTQPEFNKHSSPVIKLMQKSYDVAEKRNRIIHDAWYVDARVENLAAQYKSFPHKDLRFGIKQVDFDSITSTIESIRKLSTEAEALFVQIDASVGSSQRKSHEQFGQPNR